MSTQVERVGGLEALGIVRSGRVHWNLSPAALYEESLRRGESVLAAEGPLVARTGQHTGRSPNDKFVVKESASEKHVPQCTCRSLDGSRTTNLSFGDRPVCCPVLATSGPSAAKMPSPRRIASSYKAAGLRFQWTRPERRMPSASRPCARSTWIDMLFNSPSVAGSGSLMSDAISRAAIMTKTPIVLGRSGVRQLMVYKQRFSRDVPGTPGV